MQQFFNLNFYAVSGIINALVSIGFGVFVLSQDRKNALNFFFFLFAMLAALWSIPYVIWQIVQYSEGEALFWSRALMAGAIFIPNAFFQLVVAFLDLTKRYRKFFFVSYAVFFFYLFILIVFPSLFVRSVEPIAGIPYFPKPGVLFHGFLALWFFHILYPSYLLLNALKKTYGEKRKQIFYIFIALPIAFVNGSVNYLPWYGISVPPVTTILVSLYVPIMSYAILKHHLFNFKIAATKLATILLFIIVSFNFFLSSNLTSLIVGFFTMIFSGILGLQINKLVVREFEQKEQLDSANADLENLNNHLEQKVAEQTIEIRKAYEVEKKARLELVELDKAKDQFILTTQHHLRTPLTIVKGYISSLLNKSPETTLAESKDVLNKTSVATDRLASLVNEFLDISQMEVGKSILNKLPTNIKDLITDIAKELEPEIQKKNISLTIEAENDIVLNIDPNKMREALTNIIDNAVRYNKEGGSISIKGEKTTHPIERDKQICRLSIEDTGIGITKEELSKLFTQYFQRGKVAEKIYTTGRGLGLAISKNIIQAHGGRIYAESDGRDKGAKFIIELPI